MLITRGKLPLNNGSSWTRRITRSWIKNIKQQKRSTKKNLSNGRNNTMWMTMISITNRRIKTMMKRRPSQKKLRVARINQQRNQARKIKRRVRVKAKEKNDHHFHIFFTY
jgi:hypothetical protein